MASFYGNMKNNSRASFIFDKIYSSRAEMDKALRQGNGDKKGDGIFINRYVLIDYRYAYSDDLTDIPNSELDLYFELASLVNESNYFHFYIKEGNSYNLCTSSTNFSNNATYYLRKAYVDKLIGEPEEILPSISEEDEEEEEQLNSIPNILLIDRTEHPIYIRHRKKDLEKYGMNYDLTVWMKIYIDSAERYILVGDLKAKAPSFDVVLDAPSCEINGPHIDPRESTDLNYIYYVPKNWNVQLNNYNPDEIYDSETNDYYYYEQNLNTTKTFDESVEYPYFNQAGFNPQISIHKTIEDYPEGVYLNSTLSRAKYPKHKFRVAGLVILEEFVPNRYYTYNGDKSPANSNLNPDIAYYRKENNNSYTFIPLFRDAAGNYKDTSGNEFTPSAAYYCDSLTDDFNKFSLAPTWTPNTAYYEVVQARNANKKAIFENRADTLRIDVYLPSLGNTVADIYDIMYGKPIVDENSGSNDYNNLIGYCSLDLIVNFSITRPAEEYIIDHENIFNCRVINNVNNNTDYYFLTAADIESLSANEIEPYINPVYAKSGSSIRPYSADKILGPTSEFDNLNDILSLGSMTSDLKKLLSSLKALIINENGTLRLKANWTEQDSDYGVGYIYNKPNIISEFILTDNTNVIIDKNYYSRSIDNITGNITFTKINDIDPSVNPLAQQYYELPYIVEEHSNNYKYDYEPVASDEPYNGTGIYYNVSHEQLGDIESTENLTILSTADNNIGLAPGKVYDVAEYLLIANGSQITNHIYYLLAARYNLDNNSNYTSDIYLFHNSKPVSTIQIQTGTDIWNEIIGINNLNRNLICTLLNNLLSTTSFIVTVTYLTSANENLTNYFGNISLSNPNNVNTDGFYYTLYTKSTILKVKETEYSNGSYFPATGGNSIPCYKRIKVAISEQEDYEIHNIWNAATVDALDYYY